MLLISEEAKRLAHIETGIEKILELLAPVPSAQAPKLSLTAREIEDELVRELRAAELRHQMFPRAVTRQTAWLLLLATYRYHLSDTPLATTAALSFTQEPHATATRHLDILCKEGFIERRGDPSDFRRVHLLLTEKGRKALVNYFLALKT